MGNPIITPILTKIMIKIHSAKPFKLFYLLKGSNIYIAKEKVDKKLLIYL
jgi:hypothetical protein